MGPMGPPARSSRSRTLRLISSCGSQWFSQMDTHALVDNTADKAIDAMVKFVVSTNLTGLIFDVEDFHGNPNGRQHAELYAGWLGRLAEAH